MLILFSRLSNPRPTSIPPDFDDTFVNLGIGALLADMKEHFPTAHAQWQSQNTNVTSVFNALKKYAYRPMSTNKAINAIDCRTYYSLRFFLEKAKENGEDIALVPTWVMLINLLACRNWRKKTCTTMVQNYISVSQNYIS